VVDADIGLAVSDKHGGHPAGNMEKSRIESGMLPCIMWWTQKWWYHVQQNVNFSVNVSVMISTRI